jgi:hypothetical protein
MCIPPEDIMIYLIPKLLREGLSVETLADPCPPAAAIFAAHLSSLPQDQLTFFDFNDNGRPS